MEEILIWTCEFAPYLQSFTCTKYSIKLRNSLKY